MQLVAYGAQDIYLTGNPQITFFKVVYRRHTNFSMESIRQTWNGNVSAGSRLSATISRNGDLIHKCYIELMNCTWNQLCHNPGAHAIESIECEIGGQLIDKQYGHWMETWSELTQKGLGNLTAGVNACPQVFGLGDGIPDGSKNPIDTAFGSTKNINIAYQNGSGENGSGSQLFSIGRCVKDIPIFPGGSGLNGGSNGHIMGGNRFQQSTGMGGIYSGPNELGSSLTNTITPLTIPLYFWFCRNPGLALPLIALQYHEVKFNLELKKAMAEPNGWNGPESGGTVDLWVDYIYLDTDERRRFAQVSHEYLIEQLQYQTINCSGNMGGYEINFNHPVKELIWTSEWTKNSFHSNTISYNNHNFTHYGLKINGHDRFEKRHIYYFSKTQVLEHHTGWGSVASDARGIASDNICVYSFALNPEQHQPSGTCNFSRLDNVLFEISNVSTTGNINMYAVNYNVLRIMSGMGGLAYSN